MKRISRRLATTLTASAILAGGMSAALATPAQAASCTTSKKTFNVVGSENPTVSIKLCIYDAGSGYEAIGDMTWIDGGGGDADDNRKFDNFTLQVRVERSNVIKASRSCENRVFINSRESDNTGVYGCSKYYETTLGSGGWSADGTVIYDYDRDGLGDFTWELGGSPTI